MKLTVAQGRWRCFIRIDLRSSCCLMLSPSRVQSGTPTKWVHARVTAAAASVTYERCSSPNRYYERLLLLLLLLPMWKWLLSFIKRSSNNMSLRSSIQRDKGPCSKEGSCYRKKEAKNCKEYGEIWLEWSNRKWKVSMSETYGISTQNKYI